MFFRNDFYKCLSHQKAGFNCFLHGQCFSSLGRLHHSFFYIFLRRNWLNRIYFPYEQGGKVDLLRYLQQEDCHDWHMQTPPYAARLNRQVMQTKSCLEDSSHFWRICRTVASFVFVLSAHVSKAISDLVCPFIQFNFPRMHLNVCFSWIDTGAVSQRFLSPDTSISFIDSIHRPDSPKFKDISASFLFQLSEKCLHIRCQKGN